MPTGNAMQCAVCGSNDIEPYQMMVAQFGAAKPLCRLHVDEFEFSSQPARNAAPVESHFSSAESSGSVTRVRPSFSLPAFVDMIARPIRRFYRRLLNFFLPRH